MILLLTQSNVVMCLCVFSPGEMAADDTKSCQNRPNHIEGNIGKTKKSFKKQTN